MFMYSNFRYLTQIKKYDWVAIKKKQQPMCEDMYN